MFSRVIFYVEEYNNGSVDNTKQNDDLENHMKCDAKAWHNETEGGLHQNRFRTSKEKTTNAPVNGYKEFKKWSISPIYSNSPSWDWIIAATAPPIEDIIKAIVP